MTSKGRFDRVRAISKNADRLRSDESRLLQKISDDAKNKTFFNDAEETKWTMAFLKILLGRRAR
jgi:hypothetical protein